MIYVIIISAILLPFQNRDSTTGSLFSAFYYYYYYYY